MMNAERGSFPDLVVTRLRFECSTVHVLSHTRSWHSRYLAPYATPCIWRPWSDAGKRVEPKLGLRVDQPGPGVHCHTGGGHKGVKKKKKKQKEVFIERVEEFSVGPTAGKTEFFNSSPEDRQTRRYQKRLERRRRQRAHRREAIAAAQGAWE